MTKPINRVLKNFAKYGRKSSIHSNQQALLPCTANNCKKSNEKRVDGLTQNQTQHHHETFELDEAELVRLSELPVRSADIPPYSNLPASSLSTTNFYDLHNGDCRDYLATLPENFLDAVVTDPPYGIAYLDASWDKAVPTSSIWNAVIRAMKPGAYIVAAAAAKTHHKTAQALEDAGFEIRDQIVWSYKKSFPSAQALSGAWRSGLKTNHDPWIVARKPVEKGFSLRENWEKWGTGGVLCGATGQGTPWQSNIIQCEKPDKVDRNLGLHMLAAQLTGGSKASGCFSQAVQANDHASVKPLALMRKLCQVFCPPQGIILDPFMGSGTTGMSAIADGYQFIGCELDREHFVKACLRIDHAHLHTKTIPAAA